MLKEKILPVLLIVLLACTTLLTGCGKDPLSDAYTTAEKQVYDYYDTFKNDLPSIKKESKVLDYYEDWADAHKMYSKRIGDDALLIQKEATEGKKKAERNTMQCPIDLSDLKSTAKTTAIALTALRCSPEHGELSVLVTASDGADNLSKSDIATDNMICLTERTSPRIFYGSATMADYVITKSLTKSEMLGRSAFKITINGCEGGDSSERSRKHPNPIKEIAAVMNSCRKDGIVMELSNFEGGETEYTFPKQATATVVVASSEAKKFKSVFESNIRKYKDKYTKYESEMNYTIKQVDLPDYVYSTDDTYQILSLFYTIEDGVYKPSSDGEEESDEDSEKKEGLTAFSNIGKVSTKNNQLRIQIFIRSTDEDYFKDIINTDKEFCRLNDASFKKIYEIPLWQGKEDDTLVTNLKNATAEFEIEIKPDSTFMPNDAAILASKNSKMHTVLFGIDIQNASDLTKSLIYLICGEASK